MVGVKPNPKHLALWAIAGAFLTSSTYFITLFSGFDGNRFRLLVFLGPSLIGVVLWSLTEKRLKKNYCAGVWNDEELVPTRALLAHQAWVWIGILLFVLGLVIAGFAKHHGAMIYLTVLPLNAITSMKTSLTPPRRTTGGLIDWKSFKPLHSNHWGEAPHNHNDAVPS